MDELEELPECVEEKDIVSNTPAKLKTPPASPPVAPPPKKKARGKKTALIKRYLDNFDSTVEDVPSESDLKKMSIETLETKLKLQEQKKVVTTVRPAQLGERLVGLVSAVLDFLLKTDGEITKPNEQDEELIRCVNLELGCLSTYLGNRTQIAGHLAINTGKVV